MPTPDSAHGYPAPGKSQGDAMSGEDPSRRLSWKAAGSLLGSLAALTAIVGFVQHEFGGSGSAPHRATSSPAVTIPGPSTSSSPAHSQTPKPASTPTATYQSVSFLALCNAAGVDTAFFGCGTPIYDQVGDHIEAWAAQADANIQPQQQVSFPPTTCRSLTLNFGFNAKLDYGPSSGEAEPGLKITVTVAQSGSTSPKSVTVTANEVGTLFVKLHGGPWNISTIANQPNGGAWNIYLNGHASCTNATGVS